MHRRLTPAVAGAPGFRTGTFGINSLGTRRMRFWFALVCAISLAVPYVIPIGSAIRSEVDARPLPATIPDLSLPAAHFPQIALPSLHRAPAIPTSTPSTAAPTRSTRGVRSAGGSRVVRTRAGGRTGVRR